MFCFTWIYRIRDERLSITSFFLLSFPRAAWLLSLPWRLISGRCTRAEYSGRLDKTHHMYKSSFFSLTRMAVIVITYIIILCTLTSNSTHTKLPSFLQSYRLSPRLSNSNFFDRHSFPDEHFVISSLPPSLFPSLSLSLSLCVCVCVCNLKFLNKPLHYNPSCS